MRKNVLLLINQLHGGGAEKVIANLSISLQEKYDITLVIYNNLDKATLPFKGELIKIALPYSTDTHKNNFFKRTYRSLALIRKLRSLKKQKKINVSISFMEASNIANIVSGIGEKKIISVRSFLSHEFNDHKRLRIFKIFIKALYNKADHIVVPAKLAGQDLVSNFGVRPNKIRLIYNFIDKAFIEEKRQASMESGLKNTMCKYPFLINAGRVTGPKAQWLLPAVLKKVKQQLPEVKLLILGEGPLIGKIIEEATRNGLTYCMNADVNSSSDIYLPGFRENPFPYFNAAKVFITSSLYEGFPNVIIEAMALGLPIVSSDCASGPREILNPASDLTFTTPSLEYAPYGILTPVYDNAENNQNQYTDAAAQAIIDLLTDKNKYDYYNRQSLARASELEKNIIMQQWINLIENNN